MALARYYLQDLAKGDYNFEPEEVRHIVSAKRQKVGAEFEVFDGLGHYAPVRITAINSRSVSVEPLGEVAFEPRAKPEIEVAVAIPKSKRLQYMIEKLSEIGVNRVVPLVCERSVAGGSDPVERYTRWAIEACKQSRNLWLPEFTQPVGFKQYIAVAKSPLLLADQQGESMAKLVREQVLSAESFSCLIGPEGGFSAEEFELAESTGVLKVKLAGNILRIETAAVVLAGALMALR